MNANIQKEIKRITGIILNSVFKVLNNANISTSKKEVAAIPVTVNNDKVEVALPGYYEFVDKGRKPGKKPPIGPIINWIKKNKIDTKDIGITSLAYAISNSIGIEGTKAKPFIDELQTEIGILVRDFLVNKINTDMVKAK